MHIEVPVDQFVGKLAEEGVETRDDGRVIASAMVPGRPNIHAISIGKLDDVTFLNHEHGDIWQLIVYHADSGDIYMDGTESVVILSSDKGLEPWNEFLEWMKSLELSFTEMLIEDDVEVDPDEIEFKRDPDTVSVIQDAPLLTDWEPEIQESSI